MKKILLRLYYKSLKLRDFFCIIYNKIISRIEEPPLVRDTDETLQKIVSGGYSVSRYGDGEFALMRGENLMFQPYSKELSSRLREIIKSNKKQHIVCIPDVFDSVDWCTEKAQKYWGSYLGLNRNKIYKMLDKKKEYYDALVTRLYLDHKDKSKAKDRFEQFKIIWKDRDIILVEGRQSRLGVGNDLFAHANSIRRILCPPQDAYSNYYDILNTVNMENKSNLILIALGPTATILAYDLSNLGYQAIDIGHIDIEYEWYLKKAMEKIPLRNKYIGEIPNGSDVEDIKNIKYENEITIRIG